MALLVVLQVNNKHKIVPIDNRLAGNTQQPIIQLLATSLPDQCPLNVVLASIAKTALIQKMLYFIENEELRQCTL